MVDLFRFGQCVEIFQDIIRLVALPNYIIDEMHPHKVKNPVKLLNQRQSFHMGIVAPSDDDDCLFFTHPLLKGEILVVHRPAVNKVFHDPRHPIPVNRRCKQDDVVGEHFLDQSGMVVLDRPEPFGVMALIVDRLDRLIHQVNLCAIQSVHNDIGQQLRVSSLPGASV
jgi:hypothetical protein